MANLATALRYYVYDKMNTDPAWQGIKVTTLCYYWGKPLTSDMNGIMFTEIYIEIHTYKRHAFTKVYI